MQGHGEETVRVVMKGNPGHLQAVKALHGAKQARLQLVLTL